VTKRIVFATGKSFFCSSNASTILLSLMSFSADNAYACEDMKFLVSFY